MRTYEITKDTFHFCYREPGSATWNYFPDNVKNQTDMLNFFTQNGRLDTPELIFQGNKTGEKGKLYQICRTGNLIEAWVDFYKKLTFEPEQFMAVPEQIAFLQQKATTEVTREAEQLETEKDKLRYYLENADPDIKAELQNRINERMTETRIMELCQAHAKEYFEKDAIVEFG